MHRNLKPGNVMVTPKGQAKVLDFGLAKVLRPVGDATPTAGLTDTYALVGTMPYMAPEQLRGEAIDARTDLYARGAVLYEMATGRRPFPETVGPQLSDAILHQAPLSPRALNARVSPELERITLKCLEKDPENRYQSAKEVKVDLRCLLTPTVGSATVAAVYDRRKETALAGRGYSLRWRVGAAVAAASLVGLLVGLNVAGLRDRLWRRPKAPAGKLMLAVLPFENLGGDPQQDYLGDGLTEEMITMLSRVNPERLGVIARTSSMQYKKTTKGVDQIGRELKVDYILEGSLRRAGNRVRVTGQLLRVHDQAHVWADSYERDVSDVLALQSELAAAVARNVQIQISAQQLPRLASGRVVKPEAYEEYLKGRFSPQDSAEAMEHFKRAIENDPSYALAYAELAHAYSRRAFGQDPSLSDDLKKARELGQKALELDPALADAHVVQGDLNFYFDWNWSGGEAEFRRAAELDPGSVLATVHYSLCLQVLGRCAEAVPWVEHVVELDPLSPDTNLWLARALHLARQGERAAEQYRKTIELFPNNASAYSGLGLVYEDAGRYDEAIQASLRFHSLSGENPEQLKAYEDAYTAGGLRAYHRKVLEYQKGRAKRERLSPVTLAGFYARAGEKDQALALLEQAYQRRLAALAWLKVDLIWDPLRSDPRFQDLLRRMNFPQ